MRSATPNASPARHTDTSAAAAAATPATPSAAPSPAAERLLHHSQQEALHFRQMAEHTARRLAERDEQCANLAAECTSLTNRLAERDEQYAKLAAEHTVLIKARLALPPSAPPRKHPDISPPSLPPAVIFQSPSSCCDSGGGSGEGGGEGHEELRCLLLLPSRLIVPPWQRCASCKSLCVLLCACSRVPRNLMSYASAVRWRRHRRLHPMQARPGPAGALCLGCRKPHPPETPRRPAAPPRQTHRARHRRPAACRLVWARCEGAATGRGDGIGRGGAYVTTGEGYKPQTSKKVQYVSSRHAGCGSHGHAVFNA